MRPAKIYPRNCDIYRRSKEIGVNGMRLTLNVLLSLVMQAKRLGKGKRGNGRILILLLQAAADTVYPELSRERSLLLAFTDDPVKSHAYQKIDKQLGKFLPAGKPYPYEKIGFTEFEHALSDLTAYSNHLLRTCLCAGLPAIHAAF